MSPRSLLALGVRSLLIHKLRSALSILGVVFGVAAVVAMSSVGEGARKEALAQVGALGIDTITVRPRGAERGSPGLLLRDADAIDHVVPDLLGVAPLREAPLLAEAAGRRTEVTAVGTTPDYLVAARLTMARGRFLAGLDLSDAKRVCVLGASVASVLFPLEDPRGERLLLGGDWFDVVGVLEGRSSPKGRGGPVRTRDVNRAVFVPFRSMDRGTDPRPDGVDEIVVRVDGADSVVKDAEVIKDIAEKALGAGRVDVIVPREILRQRERTQRIFNTVTGAIAAVSLLVGGIGILNIMLASVAERIQEVGVRRALGATRKDIAAQFLVESSLLTAAGGLLGALLGILGSVMIEQLAGWTTSLSMLMLATALVVAVGVGVGFGFYPAWHAAHLEPMEALRHE